MKRAIWGVCSFGALAIAVATLGSIGTAQEKGEAKPAGLPEMKLPPGWTMEDMQACIVAGTPGKEHAEILKGVGTWTGKSSMWMDPDQAPITSECTTTVTPLMDGRFVKIEMEGDMPGMGPYKGFGLCGFDNVSQKLVATWIDNHSTGIMNGTGEMSKDGKTVTFEYTGNCPITKKPTVMREVQTITGPNSKTLEMFGTNPKTGKEFKMMKVEMTKKQ